MPTRREIVGTAVLAATASSATFAAPPSGGPPELKLVFEARVLVDPPRVVGASSYGLRRIVPITGGTISGPSLEGRVLAGGADWQFMRPDGVLNVEAKYTLESHDGVLIMVTNRGMRHGPSDVIEKLGRGEPVDPTLYYFRTAAEFEAPIGSRYEWMNRAVFIGVGQRLASAALIKFYQVL
jgi:Protein of unknown function (DUF3237)